LGFSFPDKLDHHFLADLFPANRLDQTPHVRDCVSIQALDHVADW
jgi:hypothetical protein